MKHLNFLKSRSANAKAFLTPYLRLAFLIVAFSVTNCTVSLAPKFDQGIVDDLSASSVEVFQLIAEVSGGTKNADFNQREEKYNDLIGKLEALKLQINARPMPSNKEANKILSKVNERLTQKGAATINAADTAPSATALENVIANISEMKKTDASQGLSPTAVKAFKGNITLFLDQALTYESFLNK
jgi:hypothetical protein